MGDDVTVEIKNRHVTVTGPRGKLERTFRKTSFDMYVKGKTAYVELWFGKRLQVSTVRTVATHIRNLIGEKVVRRVEMLEGVTIVRSDDVKDEVVLTGNSIENVSQSAANINLITLVRNKDVRKFLDGVYVSQAGPIAADE